MKIKLFTLLIVLASTTVMHAQRPEVLEKIEHNPSGYTKELIALDKNHVTPVRKIVYDCTSQGYMKTRVVYTYNFRKEAVALHKLECRYDEKNNPTSFILTKWDNISGKWSDKSEEMSYYYHSNGRVVVEKSSITNNILEEDFLIAKQE